MKLLPSKELEKNLNPYRCLQPCCKNAALHLAGGDLGGAVGWLLQLGPPLACRGGDLQGDIFWF